MDFVVGLVFDLYNTCVGLVLFFLLADGVFMLELDRPNSVFLRNYHCLIAMLGQCLIIFWRVVILLADLAKTLRDNL